MVLRAVGRRQNRRTMRTLFLYSIRLPHTFQQKNKKSHDDCTSKQFVNDVASIAILATFWHEVPMPPLEGEVPNEREAEGFVRKLSKKTPQSARSGCQLPFQGSQGGFAAGVHSIIKAFTHF